MGFPGYETFTAKTGTVPGKPEGSVSKDTTVQEAWQLCLWLFPDIQLTHKQSLLDSDYEFGPS